jgi:DNA-binding protein YbaB
MKYNNIQEMQKAFIKFRDELKEHVITPNKEVSLIINGKLEIIELQIDATVPKGKIESLLIESINLGIKSVSLKIQNKLTPIQNAMNR